MNHPVPGVGDSPHVDAGAASAPTSAVGGAVASSLISIVVPVYKEEGNSEALFDEITGNLPDESIEVLFVDDGSKDDSLAVIERLAARSSAVRYLRNVTCAWPLRAIALRYFSVAGAARREFADTGGENLVSKAVAAAHEGREVTVFGDDYDTPDGTCVRDYIHVVDLAEAHVLAVERLEKGSVTGMESINVGTGVGASVREMLEALRRSGNGLRMRAGARRPGDPARVVADTTRAKELLGWTARHTLEQIATSAWLAPENRDRG